MTALLLEGKVAVVTGGASGLGAATARLFAENGAAVLAADVNDEAGAAVVDSIGAIGGRARFVHADVCRAEDMDAVVSLAEETFGHLDIMVANAGLLGDATFRRTEEIPDQDWLRVIDVNLNGTFRSFRAAIPALRRSGGGALTATSSVSAEFASCYIAAYSASKGGINALVRSLSIELSPDRIRVNAVCPGAMATNIRTSLGDTERLANPSPGDPVPPTDMWTTAGWKARAISEGRDSVLDVAKVHLFLCSDLASYVNGEAIMTDGGFSIWNGV
jgi:NAD(P)-dependent dehydrogenase (short-subunit alcohol dehydrogenase family)